MLKVRIKYRSATLEDVEKMRDLEVRVWGDNAATVENLENRIKTFGRGNIVAIQGEKIVGYVGTVIVNSEKVKGYKTWYDYTDNGNGVKIYDPRGDLLFGISLTVDETIRNSGIGSMLLINIGRMAIENNLKAGILGGRLPYYYKKKELNVDDYVALRDERGRIFDPELRLYTRMGLKVEKLQEDYFKDPESLDYGVILRWDNPFYLVTKFVPFLAKPLSYLFRI